MNTAEIAAQVTAAVQELLQIGAVKAGQVLVVGCSIPCRNQSTVQMFTALDR